MKEKHVKNDLQIRVRRYLEYINEEEKKGIQKAQSIIYSLSDEIKEELLLNIYIKDLKQIYCLGSNFSDNFLNELSLNLKEISYAPDNFITSRLEDFGLYFILKGSAEIFLEKNNKSIHLKTFNV